MITAKKVRVEFQKSESAEPVGASGTIQVSDEEEGSVYVSVDNGPAISVNLADMMAAITEAVVKRKQ